MDSINLMLNIRSYATLQQTKKITERNRVMQIHELKISPKYFEDVKSDKKRFEIRKDDRDYKVGDLITLKEYENGQYTGREIKNIPIIYILRDATEYGLMDGYCILGL